MNTKDGGSLSFLDEEKPRLVLFCGKGGVGKTSCSAATALHFADQGFKTLLISSDPQPSLTDILEQNCRDKITSISRAKNLDAVELSLDTVLEMWKERYGDEVCQVISSFLPVGEELMDYLAGAPGIDEEFMLGFVLDYFESGKYDTVVWDTAPAGSTLYLLKLQEKFYKHLGEAGKLYLKVKKTLDKLKGKESDPLKLLSDWRKLAQKTLNMLRSERTQAVIVTIPEALGVFQTGRIFKELKNFRVSLDKIVVNQVISGEACACELHKGRRDIQSGYIELLQKQYGKDNLVILSLLSVEVKGIAILRQVEKILFNSSVSG